MDGTMTPLRVAVVAVLAALAGCATPPASPPATAPAPVAPAAAPGPAAVPAPVPELAPAQARAQAQKLAIEAVDELQNGDEAGARATLDRALAFDPTNELARKLYDQIRADAQRELGAVFFRYTVQRDDSLSKLAQQYLGDRFRFWILAKYNEITNPSRLAAGQVIRIPGRGPVAPAAAAAAPPAKPPEAAPEPPKPAVVAEPEPKPRDDVAAALRRAKELETKGNLDGSYAALNEAVARFPGNDAVVKQRDATRAALLRNLDREAAQAFQRQNLDLAIAKWDRILEIDPANRKARLERERALDLKKRMSEKFGAK